MTASGKDRFAQLTKRKAVVTASGKDRFARVITARKVIATTIENYCFDLAKRLRPLAVITALHRSCLEEVVTIARENYDSGPRGTCVLQC